MLNPSSKEFELMRIQVVSACRRNEIDIQTGLAWAGRVYPLFSASEMHKSFKHDFQVTEEYVKKIRNLMIQPEFVLDWSPPTIKQMFDEVREMVALKEFYITLRYLYYCGEIPDAYMDVIRNANDGISRVITPFDIKVDLAL